MDKIINGDLINVIPNLGKFKFIFCDPPFNINQNYNEYIDKVENYNEWLYNWIKLCWKHCDGILCLHGNDILVEQYLLIANKLQMKRIEWINWYYRFGQCTRSKFIDSRCHCLIFSKYNEYTWNPENVLIQSDRATKYNDNRIYETENGGMRLPGTIWGVEGDSKYWGRIQGNNKERCYEIPNQLPEVYLERLILTYTNEGDLCLDPFGGSGTSIVVGTELNRNFISIEISKRSCELIQERLNNGTIHVKLKIEQQSKGPSMHYMICNWDQESLKWNVVHYTTTIGDMERMMKEYPEDQGYVHLIELKYIKGHELMEKVKTFLARNKK